jgi:hypothetical protein
VEPLVRPQNRPVRSGETGTPTDGATADRAMASKCVPPKGTTMEAGDRVLVAVTGMSCFALR